MKTAHGSAHAKLILIGEHSVVYDKLSVGIPFVAVSIEASLTENNKDASYVQSSLYTGPLVETNEYTEHIYVLLEQIQKDNNLENTNFDLSFTSTIPEERGLGSSAALAVAIVRAFESYLGYKFDEDKFLSYVDSSEKIIHSNPSGLDARLIYLEQPLLYQKSKEIQAFYFDTPYHLVVVDTGITGHTKEAVNDVRKNYDSHFPARANATAKTIDKMDSLARDFYKLLENDHTDFNALAKVINDSHDQLRTLQVSSPEQDYGIAFALEHGAAAGKLTGGGRGGCFYLLVETKEEADNLRDLILENNLGVAAWTIRLTSI